MKSSMKFGKHSRFREGGELRITVRFVKWSGCILVLRVCMGFIVVHSVSLMPFHTCIAHKLIQKHACKRSAEKLQVYHGSSEI